MVINIELNIELQLLIMVFVFVVTSILFFIRKKKLDYSYIPIIIVSLSGGVAIYAGLLWILKPLGIIIDKSIFDSPLYNFIMGLVLIVFTIISLNKVIEQESIEKEK